MQTKTCPEGHAVSEPERVCLTCGWLFPLATGTRLADHQILAAERRHDRYFYRVSYAGEEWVLAEALEFFQPEFRSQRYARLTPVLERLNMPLLAYFHQTMGALLFLYTRYPLTLWPAVQQPLRQLLDQQGILADAELRALFAFGQACGQALAEARLLNPSLTASLIGQDEGGQWALLEWEYCVAEDEAVLYPRLYLGYHVLAVEQQRTVESYHRQLMQSALRAVLLEALTGASPVFWYPSAFSIASYKALFSQELLRWLEDFERASDPRTFRPPLSFYKSTASRHTLQTSAQLFAEGYRLYQAGQIQNAYPSFEQATRQSLLFAQGYRFLALCVRQHDYALFLRLLEQALRIDTSACFYLERAEGHVLHAQVEAAAADLLQALKLQHYFPEAWYLLGSCQERMRQFPLAEMAYKEALKQRKSPQFNLALAQLYEKQGLSEKAKQYRISSLKVGARAAVHVHEAPVIEQVSCTHGHLNAPEQGFCGQCQEPLGLEVGAEWQGYRITACLRRREPGAENYSAVYRAQDRLGRDVLLKELFVPAQRREAVFEKYTRLAELQHTYIQAIEAVFVVAPFVYLVYPWKEGQSLQDLMARRGALSEAQAWQVLITIASVIIYLQAADLPRVHGDIKPANILLTAQGDILLLDLDSVVTVKPGTTRLLSVATYPYAPPEQFLHKQVDLRSDGYALGVTLLACLTGVFPEVFISHRYQAFHHWQEHIPHISAALRQIVTGLIAWKPERRLLITPEHLRQWLTCFKSVQPLPVPADFQAFQTRFWAVYRAAATELDQAVEGLLKHETNRVTLFYCASRYVQEARYREALALLRNIQRLGSDFENGLWLLAEVYFQLGYYQAAVDVLNQTLENSRDVFWPYVLLARTYRQLKKIPLALAAYQQAQRHHAPDAYFLEYLSFLFQQGYFIEVRNEAHEKLKCDDVPHERAYLHGVAGMSLLNLGFAEDALPDLCASLHVEPEQPAVIFSLGKAYLQLRRLSEAEQQFERCLQAEPGHRGARFYLARTWIEQKLFEKGLQALHDLQQAPLSAVEYRDLCFQKARALTLLQRFDQAETCYQELLRLFPCEAVCVNYGNLCLIVHQYAQAVQLFEQALTFNPASAEARRGLALASVQTP